MSEPYQPATGGCLNMDNQSGTVFNRTLLLEMNLEMMTDLMPAIIYLVVLMLIGSVGNFLVIYIIGWKLKTSAQNSLFMWLGVFDIITCVIGMPSEIADLSQYYLYENAVACKIMRFLLTITAISSANLLVIIAIDRFRRVCRPLHGQMEMCHVKVGVALAALVALVVAGPALSLYGGRTVATPVPGLSGCDCSVQDKYKGRLYPLLYEMVFGAAFVGYTVVLTVLYVRIWLEIRRHRRYMASHFIPPAGTSSDQFRSTESEEELEEDKVSRVVSARSRMWLLFRGKKEKEYHQCAAVEDEKAELCGSQAGSPCLRRRSVVGEAGLRECGAGHSCNSSGLDKNGSSGSDRSGEIIPVHNCSPSSTQHAGGSDESSEKCFSNKSTSAGRATEIAENCLPNGGGGKLTVSSPAVFLTQAVETAAEGTERISTQQNAADYETDSVGHAGSDVGSDPSPEKSAGCVTWKHYREQRSLLTPQSQAAASTISSAFSSTTNVGRSLAASTWDLSVKIRKSLRANKLTIVAVAVTAVFVLSYLPHLCLITLRSVEGGLDDHRLTGAQLVFYNIFLRSYFVNSVANVFVYSAVNPEFRRHCKRLCRSLCCWCRIPKACYRSAGSKSETNGQQREQEQEQAVDSVV